MRDPPQQHGGHRGYRQRDHHGGGDRDNNNRNGRNNNQSSFGDASREHGIPGYFYDDPPIETQRSARRTSDRVRGHHQRGRDRGRKHHHDRPQPSNSRRNSMPPPAPRPLRANEDKVPSKIKSAPKKDRPKTIPQTNRDKCGACSQDHDIRFCPYPNTEDGRTKICPICDTTKHAWHECWYYKRDITEQWNVCWDNRRCLPTLVHDASLDEILGSRVSLARETSNEDEPSPLENFNNLPGPLSPAFVKKLMPINCEDAHIIHEVQKGRIVPWELVREALEDNQVRINSAMRDKSTMDMSLDRFIAGTRSSVGSVPAASKQRFFNNMDAVMESNQRAFCQILEKRPCPDVVTCDNCVTEGHETRNCPILCKECGMIMSFHNGTLVNGQCREGCICRDKPGHTRPACDRPCRPCIIEDRDSDTDLKACKRHCPLQLCLIEDEQTHLWCARDHVACPLCWGRHWHQDCPKWLGTLCLRQDCLATGCNAHCHMCGGFSVEEIMSYFPENDNVAYRQHVQALVRKWHHYLDNYQCKRIGVPDADIKHSSWSILRCKRHFFVTADACSLEKKRVDTWKKVVDCVRGGFTEETISEAARLLRVPECSVCFDQQRHN